MNKEISILISGQVTNSAVFVQSFYGLIIKETEKAYQIHPADNNKATLWIPKKALIKSKHGDFYKIAKWFKPNSYQNDILCKYSRVGGVSCA